MKIPKQAYMTEYKELAVKRIKEGQSVSKVCKELGLSDQTLRNWVKAAAEGKVGGAGGKVVMPKEMELSRLRAENLRLKRELEITKKRRRTSQGMFCEVRLDCRARKCVRPRRNVRRARRQHQRLSGLEAWRQAGSPAPV